ncbi:VCBS domain-containing protein [Pseudodesulfovibrio sediminis]|uniref:RapA2 cadherin-like domain-containing protein n=1 Tax=Pseudodesulfovibrio sediminis TaxID=2810563 RepID=A0ABN6ERE0_9BACT|nr:VCBS domain-containing protein [Pseudodesulfovibrio sediminis]BCS87997.1 hypothetical protein PSDVSF_12390 [Pseudodesulfovibrio sediminis]
MASSKTPMKISLPGAGKSTSYSLLADTPVKFDFDISEAAFNGANGNLEIAIEGGGTVILENYQTLAESDSLPTFVLMDGAEVAGDVYLFAFSEADATAEDLETAADGATGGSGAGAYSDDAGTLGDGLDALGGQDDAYASRLLAASPDSLGNNPPVANDDFAEVTEQGEVDLHVDPEDNTSHLYRVEPVSTYFRGQGGEGGEMYDGGEYQARLFGLPTGDDYEISPDGESVIVNKDDAPYMTMSAGSAANTGNELITDTYNGIGVDNNNAAGTNGDYDPAINNSDVEEWIDIDFEDPQGYVQIVLGGFNEFRETTDEATITLFDAEGNEIETVHMGLEDGNVFSYTPSDPGAGLVSSIRVSSAGDADDTTPNNFYIQSVTSTPVPEGVFFPTNDNEVEGGGWILNYPEGEHSFLTAVNAEGSINLLDNDFDVDHDHALLRMNTIDFIGEETVGLNPDATLIAGNDEPATLVDQTTGVETEVMGQYGTLYVNALGEYRYVLDPDLADHLEEGQVETEVFDYTIVDPEGAVSNVASLTITVFGTNDSPVALADQTNEAIEVGDSTDYFLPDDYPGTNFDGGEGKNTEGGEGGEGGMHDYTQIVSATGNVLLNDTDVDDLDYQDSDNPDTPDVVEGEFSSLFVVGVYSNESHEYDWLQVNEGNSEANYTFPPGDDGQIWDIAQVDPKAEMTIAGKYGHLTIGADGDYTYTPDISPAVEVLNYDNPGEESFTYGIMDDGGAFSYATITFTVNGANDAPIAYSNEASVTEYGNVHAMEEIPESEYGEGTATGNVITDENNAGQTDYDVDNDAAGIFVESISHDGNTVAVYNYDADETFQTIDGDYGTLKIWEDGHYEYELDNSNPEVQALNVDLEGGTPDTLTETFTYVTTNENQDGVNSELSSESDNPSVLTITINGTNDAPVAIGDMDHGIMLTEEFTETDGASYRTIDFGDTTPTHDYWLFGLDFGDGDPTWWEEAANQGVTISARNNSGLGEHVTRSHGGIGVDTHGPWDSSQVGSGSWTHWTGGWSGHWETETYREELVIDFADGRGEVTMKLGHLFGRESATLTAYDANWNVVDTDTATRHNSTITLDPAGSATIAHVILTPNGRHSDFNLLSLKSEGPSTQVRDVTADVANVSGNVLANDSDVDDVNLSAALVGSAVGLYGSLVLDADGDYTYTVDADKIDSLHDSYVETFQYEVVDSHGASETATLHIPLHYEALNEVTGTTGHNTLTGTVNDDIIDGMAGNDVINSGQGDDVLIGGAGHDQLNGGSGDDMVFGDDGNDIIYASSGDDTVTLGEGADIIMIDPQYIDDGGATLHVTDFNVAEGDSLQLAGTLTSGTTNVEVTSNSNDITLTFTDLNHDGTATSDDTLSIILSDVNPAAQSYSGTVEITNSDDINSLIQQIIDSPDNN